MQNSQLDRMLELMRRTGDKAFVMDKSSDQVFMLMGLDDYEGLIDLLEDEKNPTGDDPIDDYILDDIIDTQEKKSNAGDLIPPPPKPEVKIPEPPKDPAYFPIEEIKPQPVVRNEAALNFTETWPEDKKPVVEEVNMQDVPHDDEDSEKFFVEPVE